MAAKMKIASLVLLGLLFAEWLLLSGEVYAQSGATAAMCKEFDTKAKRCMSRAITIDSAEESGEGGGNSSQAEAFRECYNLYCRYAIIGGCSISDTCKYGLPPGRAEIQCDPGEHLIFHGAGKSAECQKNAQGSGTPLPPNRSTITDRTSQGKPTCADTGEWVYCDAIWVNGKCIYD